MVLWLLPAIDFLTVPKGRFVLRFSSWIIVSPSWEQSIIFLIKDCRVRRSDKSLFKNDNFIQFEIIHSQHIEKLLLCFRVAYENFRCCTRPRSTIETEFFRSNLRPPWILRREARLAEFWNSRECTNIGKTPPPQKIARKPLQSSSEIEISTSQALGLSEFGNETIGNVDYFRLIVTLFVGNSNRNNKIFSKV